MFIDRSSHDRDGTDTWVCHRLPETHRKTLCALRAAMAVAREDAQRLQPLERATVFWLAVCYLVSVCLSDTTQIVERAFDRLDCPLAPIS